MNPEFSTQWISPSNIALVKYWGKFGDQMPENPSISFTLKESVTTLSLSLTKSHERGLTFLFDGLKNHKFEDKIIKFLLKSETRFPWLKNYHLVIHSNNTFPHSSGIASSASSMSALCLALISADEFVTGVKLTKEDFFKSASELSRLASGSASRSLFKGIVTWGQSNDLSLSSNLFAAEFKDAHEVFKDYRDSILIVDDKEKSVSSRAGHDLMQNHPYKAQRFIQAKSNFSLLIKALSVGDLKSFIKIVEEEALTLHALMMTSNPSYILLKPESLWIIEQVKKFRSENNIPVCFTIDAGPNIHLLYPKVFSNEIRNWIETELSYKLVGVKWIHDEVGIGPSNASEKI